MRLTSRVAARSIVSVVLLCASSVVRLDATVVVMLVTPDRIVIAADSKETAAGQRSTHESCKIWLRGATAAAASGNVMQGGYDLRVIVPAALVSANSPLTRWRAAIATLQRQQLASDHGEVGILFAAFDGKLGPSIAGRTVPIPIVKVPAPYACAEGKRCSGVVTLTPPSVKAGPATARAGERVTQRLTEAEMVNLARAIVNEQAAAYPGIVGGPTDVVVLDAAGGRWIAVKPGCR